MTLRRLTAVLALVALAGCTHFQPPGSSETHAAPGTPQRACEDAAEADRSLNAYAAANAPANVSGGYDVLLAQLQRDSVTRCLQQRGALPAGGVERVR